jgi:hypothetical protein
MTRSFKNLRESLEILAETTLSGGADAKRHAEKYITPYVGQKDTHTLKQDHGDIKAGEKVTVHGYHNESGKYHAVVSKGSSQKHDVPFSKINKPTVQKNKGFDFESHLVNKLKQHGLMHGEGAGFTAGNDFHVINKKTGTKFKGKMAEHAVQGEAKKDLSAAFGQASLKHDPKKGWHFTDQTKQKFPHYTAAIEKAHVTVGKKKIRLIDHVNSSFGAPTTAGKSKTNVYSDKTDLHPMHSYLKDHHVDLLHVGSHGTFNAGLSHEKDRTGLKLPKANGEGAFRVRQKHHNSLTVQFNVKKMDKSSVDISKDEHIDQIKKKLGH